MGQKLAKPNPPSDNVAKAEANLAMEGMTLAADNFLNVIRLGTASSDNLGYTLVGRKLISQQIEMIAVAANNVTASTIDTMIDSLFSGDWKTVAKVAAGALVQFLSPAPQPSDTASQSEFKASYLLYEFGTIIQYSIYIKKTMAKSVGTVTENNEYASLVCLAKGIVDYAEVDPQLILFKVRESMETVLKDDPNKFAEIMTNIAKELQAAAELTKIKRSLLAGVPEPKPFAMMMM